MSSHSNKDGYAIVPGLFKCLINKDGGLTFIAKGYNLWLTHVSNTHPDKGLLMYMKPISGDWAFDTTWRAHKFPFEGMEVNPELKEAIIFIKEFAKFNKKKGMLYSLTYYSKDKLDDLAKGVDLCESTHCLRW